MGVQAEDGTHELIRSGDLPSAVMASCAMPYVFHAVHVDGRPLRDGGAMDRLGLDAWRAWRPDRSAIAHWVDRTAGRDVQADLRGVRLVKTPRSGAKLWSLGDFDAQRAEARRITAAALSSVGARRDARRPSA